MESVRCFCKSCLVDIGLCRNSWTKLGTFYASPVKECLAINSKGPISGGRKGWLVEHCYIQSVVCANCFIEIGFNCIVTPVNHALEKGQVFLRLNGLMFYNLAGNDVELVFKRFLAHHLRTDPAPLVVGPSPSAYGTFGVIKLQSELQLQSEDISRIDTNGAKVFHGLESGLTNVEREVKKLQDTLSNVRRDVGGVEEDIKSVKTEVGEVEWLAQSHPPAAAWEERLGSVTSTIGEVQEEITGLASLYDSQLTGLKAELTRNKQHVESLESYIKQSARPGQHDQVMAGILAELAQLRREMDGTRTEGQVRTSAPFASPELQVLMVNNTKCGSRANQVEPRQMELEILNGRVERMDASRQISDSDFRPRPVATGTRQDSPSQLKRSLSMMSGPITQDAASKKQMVSPPGCLNMPIESHDIPPEQEDTIPSTSATYRYAVKQEWVA